MKKKYPVFTLAIYVILSTMVTTSCSSNERKGAPRVLVFSKTAGFRHSSIPDGKKAIQKLGQLHQFIVDTTENPQKFNEENLKQYSAVIFLNTTGDVLNNRQQADFKRYIQAGGGYVGVHSASDTEYEWPWYGELVGAYFEDHPQVQPADLNIHQDENFPMLDSLPDPWNRSDEWYNFLEPPENVNVLMNIDEGSYEGGTMNNNHPMVWYHFYDGGRSFYMEIGHTKESYTEPNFLSLMLGGIQYAIGNNELLSYDQVSQLQVPEENRFSRELLAKDLAEPTELTILPNLDILVAERRGDLKLYDVSTKDFSVVSHLDVYDTAKNEDTNGNVEMGFMGLKKDPNYSENHWIYAYYSPAGERSVDRLSRFKYENQEFDKNSEQIILEVPTRRETCCHTGGSIAFDSEDNLYVSTGDNTTPFNEKNPETGEPFTINTYGYAPLDDRPGFEQFDDARAAGNTNDLRGKILRINVKEDGSYDIPEGNLFPSGTPQTKPEIYVMGNRNPYRISVDKKTGYLYWGEVGPDANVDSMKTRGPRGYDEVNQAKEAGNFGWPFLIGNNYSYRRYNYETGESGAAFDPAGPVNNSRNNDGLDTLPPAQPAFIWYPYAQSDEFPSLGSGGRTAMAGPVYYTDEYPEETRLPDYYDGKFFIYEWMRGWIKAVTFDEDHQLQTIEPFMAGTDFVNISDMEVGPDGRIYEVEYGSGWFSPNPDAGLYVITYNSGNRPPIASIQVKKNAGAVPFKVHFSAEGSTDPDSDSLTYLWDFGNGVQKTTEQPEITYEYKSAGEYTASLTVKDTEEEQAKSQNLDIIVGNDRPEVTINLKGNRSFYFPELPVEYEVEVQDKEDGRSDQSSFDTSTIKVQAEYLQSPDEEAMQEGHLQQAAAVDQGQTLIQSMDCQACHKMDSKSIGPSYKQVAQKYADNPDAMNYLPHKIINGGSGVWGETAMAAHPNLSESDAKAIVRWILSNSEEGSGNSLPISGSIIPAKRFELSDEGVIYLSASYTDGGGENTRSLRETSYVPLRNPFLKSVSADKAHNFSEIEADGQNLYVMNDSEGWLKFDQVSLQQVQNIVVKYGIQSTVQEGWELQLRMNRPDGELIGQAILGPDASPESPSSQTLELTQMPDTGFHDIYFVVNQKNTSEESVLGLIGFKLQAR